MSSNAAPYTNQHAHSASHAPGHRRPGLDLMETEEWNEKALTFDACGKLGTGLGTAVLPQGR